jgi:hypothetical protein
MAELLCLIVLLGGTFILCLPLWIIAYKGEVERKRT